MFTVSGVSRSHVCVLKVRAGMYDCCHGRPIMKCSVQIRAGVRLQKSIRTDIRTSPTLTDGRPTNVGHNVVGQVGQVGRTKCRRNRTDKPRKWITPSSVSVYHCLSPSYFVRLSVRLNSYGRTSRTSRTSRTNVRVFRVFKIDSDGQFGQLSVRVVRPKSDSDTSPSSNLTKCFRLRQATAI